MLKRHSLHLQIERFYRQAGRITNTVSGITSGDNLALLSQGNQRVEGANLNSGGTFTQQSSQGVISKRSTHSPVGRQ